jgi:cytochrome c oxidase subunit III
VSPADQAVAGGPREGHPLVIDVSDLGVHHNGRSAPLYWGILGLIAVEATVFGGLLSSYLYLRLVSLEWPPGGVDPPDLLLPTINTVILLVSSAFVHMADQGIRHGRQLRLKVGLGVAIVLALAFLVIKGVEYSGEVGYRWDSHAYASAVWTITGFHSFHVIALVLKTIVMEILALRGYFNQERNLGVQINGVYWHFVVAVWIPIYIILYWVPRLPD